MRLNYYEFTEGVDPHTRYLNGASNKGGHCDRSGSCFEVTPIQLGKNNSRFMYNHHL